MATTTASATEQRIVLRNIRWETYESLLRDHEDSSAPRFTYDRGVLEIMSPLPEHERYARRIESLADALVLERGVNIDSSFRSTTFKLEQAQRGFEADACFYTQNEPRVRGKGRIDPRVDPPPDIAVEIDITHTSFEKLPVYMPFGVPEVWRYDGERLRILVLEGDRYLENGESRALPGVTSAGLSDVLREDEGLGWAEWLQLARSWARELGGRV